MTIAKIVVGVLTHNRPLLLEETLRTFHKYLKPKEGLFKFVIYDNGSTEENLEKNKKLAQRYQAGFVMAGEVRELPKDSKTRDHNISIGHRNLSRLMKEKKADAYFLLEDDWACIAEIPLIELVKYLKENPEIGQIRLRDCLYDGTLTGGAKHNFVTQEPIHWSKKVKMGQYMLAYGNLHWVNNPSLISRQALELVSQGFDSEVACMEAFHKVYPINLQLQPGVFKHIGPWRQREDLMEQGIIQGGESHE